MIRQYWYDLVSFINIMKNFLKNIWFFRKELSEYYKWDYHGMLLLNKKCLEGMHEYQSTVEDSFVSVNRDKTCLEMKKAIKCLERLIEDDYIGNKLSFTTEGGNIAGKKLQDLPTEKGALKHMPSIKEQDLKYLAKFWDRYLLHCWH